MFDPTVKLQIAGKSIFSACLVARVRYRRFRKFGLGSLLLLGLTLLISFHSVSAQRSGMFEVTRIEREVKSRFSLSRRDAKAIEPFLKEENFRTVELYSRVGGEEPEYSGRVWRQVVDDRLRFESKVATGFTVKQVKAIRSARSRLEERLLRYLIEDYLAFLSEILLFGDLEYNDVAKLLESEADKKLILVSAHISEPSVLIKALDSVTRETETGLRKAMSPEQWHGFRKLTDGQELIG
jgi:hypothetical protein